MLDEHQDKLGLEHARAMLSTVGKAIDPTGTPESQARIVRALATELHDETREAEEFQRCRAAAHDAGERSS